MKQTMKLTSIILLLLLLIGCSEKKTKEDAGTRPYLEQSLAITRKVLGEEHPHTADSLSNLGILLRYMGDSAAARPYYEQSLEIRLKLAKDLLPALSEAEALAYVEATQSGRDPLLSILRSIATVCRLWLLSGATTDDGP